MYITVHTGAKTIQGRKLFKGGNYLRKYSKHWPGKFIILFFERNAQLETLNLVVPIKTFQAYI